MKKNLLIFATLAFCATALPAQTLPVAPIPAQLSSAKTIFLGNGGSLYQNKFGLIAYNDIYQRLSALNRYRLKLSPADAELLMEVSLNIAVSDATNGTSFSKPYLNLTIRDARSHALLWTFAESISGAFREKSIEKNIDEAAAKIVSDFTSLTATDQTAATAAEGKK